MRINRLYTLLLLVISISGCVSSSRPPATLYTLNPDLGAILSSAGQPATQGNIIKLGRMNSNGALKRPDILYVTTGHQQNSYAYSQWSNAPTAMLLAVFQQALEMSGQLYAVLPPSSLARPDLVLESTLFDFSHHINDDNSSTGVIRVTVNLVDYKNKQIIASKTLSASEPASKQDARSAVEALNRATASIIRQLLDWLSAELPKLRS